MIWLCATQMAGTDAAAREAIAKALEAEEDVQASAAATVHWVAARPPTTSATVRTRRCEYTARRMMGRHTKIFSSYALCSITQSYCGTLSASRSR